MAGQNKNQLLGMEAGIRKGRKGCYEPSALPCPIYLGRCLMEGQENRGIDGLERFWEKRIQPKFDSLSAVSVFMADANDDADLGWNDDIGPAARRGLSEMIIGMLSSLARMREIIVDGKSVKEVEADIRERELMQ